MNKSSKLIVGASAFSLSAIALATYFKHKNKKKTAATWEMIGGMSAGVALWTLAVEKLNGKFAKEIGYHEDNQPFPAPEAESSSSRSVARSLEKDEKYVELFLKNVVKSPNDFSFEFYQRKALSKGKRNEYFLHSLYVITDHNLKREMTLSYNGTKTSLTSTGAWALNTEMDIEGYKSFKNGKNVFDMTCLIPAKIIDVEKTAQNIILSIQSSKTYFALDHKIDKKNAENCNTAIFNTIVLKEPFVNSKHISEAIKIPSINDATFIKQGR